MYSLIGVALIFGQGITLLMLLSKWRMFLIASSSGIDDGSCGINEEVFSLVCSSLSIFGRIEVSSTTSSCREWTACSRSVMSVLHLAIEVLHLDQ